MVSIALYSVIYFYYNQLDIHLLSNYTHYWSSSTRIHQCVNIVLITYISSFFHLNSFRPLLGKLMFFYFIPSSSGHYFQICHDWLAACAASEIENKKENRMVNPIKEELVTGFLHLSRHCESAVLIMHINK